jgi:hypothetical protein
VVATVSGHDITTSFDCARPGCDGHANVDDGLCPHCSRLARASAQAGAASAGKLETTVHGLLGLAREFDGELRLFREDVAEARRVLDRRA